jgi:hypothetical protein
MSVFDAAINEINIYREYELDWDSYGAKPFSDEVIEKSILVVNKIANSFTEMQIEPDQITPGPVSDGRIDIELLDGSNHTIFTVDSEEKTLTVCLLVGDMTHEETVKYDETDLDQWISLFV